MGGDLSFRPWYGVAQHSSRKLLLWYEARHTSAHVPAVGGSYLQVHFGVSGRAGSAHGVMPLLLTASLRTLLAEKPTAVEAAICSASPVLGFRPVRAARARGSNDPKPMNDTWSSRRARARERRARASRNARA